MRVRDLAAAKIAAALDAAGLTAGADYSLRSHPPASLGELEVATGFLRIQQVTPGTIPGSWWDVTLTLVLAVPRTDPGAGDDDLDDWLADVLAALETDDALGLRWTTAERAVLDESWPAYDITLTATISKETT